MDVVIQQAVSRPPSYYEIETPGCIYTAKKKWLSLRGAVDLFAPRERLVTNIFGRLVLFEANFEFPLSDGRKYNFWLEKIWKGVSLCEGEKENYQLYRHQGLDYSIFQGQPQIAAFTKTSVVVGAADKCESRVNDDPNLVAILGMVLAIAMTESEGGNSTFTYDGQRRPGGADVRSPVGTNLGKRDDVNAH
jgi:hypothetical protein